MKNTNYKPLLILLFLMTSVAGFCQQQPTPFAVADKAPVYPGCETMDAKAQKDCTVDKITNHVNTNFKTGIGKELNLSGRQRIVVKFVIGEDGKIKDVESRSLADDPEVRASLQAEATRVIQALPQMQPGELQGNKVAIGYSLPIEFATVQQEEN